jgi:carbonic anhydrase
MNTRLAFLSSAAGAACLAANPLAALAAAATVPAVGASEAWERLKAGNERFAGGRMRTRDQVAVRRSELVGSQHPFAIVLSCSDSRVPPEVVFDQGLGDLFSIRIAGAVADDAGLGSLEYAVEHLHVRLLVVLGHESCGAVDASLAALKGSEINGHVRALVDLIEPALSSVAADPGPGIINAVKATVRYEVGRLARISPVLAKAQAGGDLRIRGAYYGLADGLVTRVS